MPVLQGILQLREGDYGILKSSLGEEQALLGKIKFVRRRMGDIMKNLDRSDNYIGGVLSDERALEAILESQKEGRKAFGERVCGIEVPDTTKNVSQLKFLVRKEDREEIDKTGGLYATAINKNNAVCISSFPNIARQAVHGRMLVEERDGQLESILRSNEVPGAIAILDLVSSGKTATQFNLESVGKPLLTAYPSIWTPTRDTSIISDFKDFLLEKLRQYKDIRLPKMETNLLAVC